MRVGDDVLAQELEAALYELDRLVEERGDEHFEAARTILVCVIRVLRDRIEALT